MDTALYYTFSTIAQALASAMALLSAFALFRLSAIGSECMGLAVIMEAETGGGINVRAMATIGNWKGVVTAIKKRLETGFDADSNLARCFRLEMLVTAQKLIMKALWVSLLATAITMGGAIGVLAFVPSIYTGGFASAALGIGIAASTICLGSYGWLVMTAFRGLK